MNRCGSSSCPNHNHNEETEGGAKTMRKRTTRHTDCSSRSQSIPAGLIDFTHFNLDISRDLSPIGRIAVATTTSDVRSASGCTFLQSQRVPWRIVTRMNRMGLCTSGRRSRGRRQLLVIVLTFLATLIPHRIAVDLVGVLVLRLTLSNKHNKRIRHSTALRR